jgi:hypothetical protein
VKHTFLITLHSSRTGNLNQMLRLLARRDPEVLPDSELLLMCQDKVDPEQIESVGFRECNICNLEWESYNRSRQVNIGVAMAKGENLAILDSDRILPAGYFQKNLGSAAIVTTHYLHQLKHDVPDNQIHSAATVENHRSLANEPFHKNAFSGNTLITKSMFRKLGGMDEKYMGYGFEDADATQTALSLSIPVKYLEVHELHLCHPNNNYVNGTEIHVNQLRMYTAINGMRYFRKWGLPFPEGLLHRIRCVLKAESEYQELPWFDRFKASTALLGV